MQSYGPARLGICRNHVLLDRFSSFGNFALALVLFPKSDLVILLHKYTDILNISPDRSITKPCYDIPPHPRHHGRRHDQTTFRCADTHGEWRVAAQTHDRGSRQEGTGKSLQCH